MDNLTHSLTGLFLSRAGLDRVTPRAQWILLLAANAADCDIVSALPGALSYLHWHRHFTHAVLFAPVLALLAVLAVRLISRRPLPWLRAWLVSLAGVASHLALDWTNIYGVRLALPLSGRWFRADLTSVVDLWIWAVFLLCVVGPLISKLVGSEIGAAQRAGTGRAYAIAALSFLVLYNGGRAILHQRAVAVLESHMYGGSAPVSAAALPGPWNPLRWRGVVETAESLNLVELDLRAEFDPAAGRSFPKPDPSPAIERARGTPAFRGFEEFSQIPFWRVLPYPEPEGAVEVQAMDLRFCTPSQPGFVAGAILDARLNVVRNWFTFGQVRPK